ncbi:MAG TPA: GNAT family N-acetyltransferase [Ktedonobacteraceae bacterium]|nr:GNAT family N-acetyltransferase [Ktedonobacteraceae bacterium]
MIELESTRLRIRELTAEDLPALLEVYMSNVEFRQQMEGSEGEAGRYDLERFQRDWHIAQMMGRYTAGAYLKENGAVIGYIEYIEEHDDGKPFLGALTIHADYQRQGLGTETFERLAQHFREDNGWTVLHCGIMTHNKAGLAFAQQLGFQPYKRVSNRISGGLQEFVLLEISL